MGVSRDCPNFWVPPIISGTSKATDFKFGGYIYRANPNKSPLKILEKGERGRNQGVPKIFRAPMYKAHCAVIFAIAQLSCYQRVKMASYANRSQRRNVRPSVCLSVCHTPLRYCMETKKASVMISSPSESLNILVFGNIWVITKFERGHPERGRFMILGWVKMAILTIFRPIFETVQDRTKVAIDH